LTVVDAVLDGYEPVTVPVTVKETGGPVLELEVPAKVLELAPFV
jgi:hypothetical protein